ncbi:hypothetical protein Osc7112_6838 (plasmid) [Oscillatoria nigro-viridis PCC 7112]|uniref:Uncharacterized protein n=1 Tax=Phormidium nigroviride PCC 7112 TaxID=179408 RepID=K9VS73_9CYAN|nr:hypothetical protein Osc7112_6838 [Oscillatoria nigro-viridis PCC 7112]
MPHIEKKTIKRFFGVVLTVYAIGYASCSGASKQVVNYSATHSVKNPLDSVGDSIIAQPPLTTALNRNFFAIGFEAIGGAA